MKNIAYTSIAARRESRPVARQTSWKIRKIDIIKNVLCYNSPVGYGNYITPLGIQLTN